MVWRTALLITDFSPEYKCPNIQITTSTTIFSTNRNRIFVRVIDIKSIASSEKKWTIEENRRACLRPSVGRIIFPGAYIYVSYTALRKYRLALLPVVAMVDKNATGCPRGWKGPLRIKSIIHWQEKHEHPPFWAPHHPFPEILNNSKLELIFKNKFILETWMT